ncbi:HemX protein, negative effector of steady-state concentration of glutamyl-tRNA reductase [Acidisarcina polymorpha]|uniref:HemX protein, negative effector of steady-state concentration of glutamyl-tRNA reductase n=1 Tax=Acidisarcina polymorpha TaxID=2211140 RepID=A0A2Z5G7V0_9BACT|nr:cytochrome c biogenesis protein CcsA [Acidisarcina polymorpha]AXC15049.1 HemX protein, negative effector of steady-state concentration of glutamyl-tRNA reductase [Acidisarcina polymorpha]
MFILWLRVAAFCYGIATVCALPAVLYTLPRWTRVFLMAATAGFVFHFVSIAEMLGEAHRWMPVGTREMQSLLGLLIVAAFLMIWLRYRALSFGLFALPLALLLILFPAIGLERYTFTSPVVRNGWIIVHVCALLAAYAALLFSLLASFLYLVQERRLKDRRKPSFLTWLPPLETINQIGQRALVIGFHCMTAGLLIGSIMAQSSVGPAYFLDPKVLLSFAMWLLYIGMLLVRRSTGLRGRRAVYWSSLVFLVMLTVWAANLFSSVHRFSVP